MLCEGEWKVRAIGMMQAEATVPQRERGIFTLITDNEVAHLPQSGNICKLKYVLNFVSVKFDTNCIRDCREHIHYCQFSVFFVQRAGVGCRSLNSSEARKSIIQPLDTEKNY